MRRNHFSYQIREGAAPVAPLQGPTGYCPPVTVGPDPFDDDEYLQAVLAMARADDVVAAVLPWLDRVSYTLCAVVLFIAAQPIAESIKAAF